MKQLAVILVGFIAAVSCGFYAIINNEFTVNPTINRHIESPAKQTNITVDNRNLVCNYTENANQIMLDHCKVANDGH